MASATPTRKYLGQIKPFTLLGNLLKKRKEKKNAIAREILVLIVYYKLN